MKLFRKDFAMWKNEIYILPSIEIRINNMEYPEKNWTISFHWLIFHARLLFLESEV